MPFAVRFHETIQRKLSHDGDDIEPVCEQFQTGVHFVNKRQERAHHENLSRDLIYLVQFQLLLYTDLVTGEYNLRPVV